LTQDHIPGLEPEAYLTLTTYLMPDGHVSHYEIEGRSPGGALTHARSQASTERFEYDPAWQETVGVYTQWVLRAVQELRAADMMAAARERAQRRSEHLEAPAEGREAGPT